MILRNAMVLSLSRYVRIMTYVHHNTIVVSAAVSRGFSVENAAAVAAATPPAITMACKYTNCSDHSSLDVVMIVANIKAVKILIFANIVRCFFCIGVMRSFCGNETINMSSCLQNYMENP